MSIFWGNVNHGEISRWDNTPSEISENPSCIPSLGKQVKEEWRKRLSCIGTPPQWKINVGVVMIIRFSCVHISRNVQFDEDSSYFPVTATDLRFLDPSPVRSSIRGPHPCSFPPFHLELLMSSLQYCVSLPQFRPSLGLPLHHLMCWFRPTLCLLHLLCLYHPP